MDANALLQEVTGYCRRAGLAETTSVAGGWR